MVLTQKDIDKIAKFVKKEPRTVQEIARHISRSWVTADSYIGKMIKQTGLVNIKVFRPGTKGAIKLVYWNYEDAVEHDEIKKMLYDRIRLARVKYDFDPFEVFQHVPKKGKRAMTEVYTDPAQSTKQDLIGFLSRAKQELYCFSGNNSWLFIKERGTPILRVVEDLLKRGVQMKILTRVDLGSVENMNKISRLMKRYPDQIEIRHAYQPLRGFLIDGEIVRLKDEKEHKTYKKGELKGNLRVFYEWTDPDWTYWMQQVFWNLYRNAPTAEDRLKQLNEIF